MGRKTCEFSEDEGDFGMMFPVPTVSVMTPERRRNFSEGNTETVVRGTADAGFAPFVTPERTTGARPALYTGPAIDGEGGLLVSPHQQKADDHTPREVIVTATPRPSQGGGEVYDEDKEEGEGNVAFALAETFEEEFFETQIYADESGIREGADVDETPCAANRTTVGHTERDGRPEHAIRTTKRKYRKKNGVKNDAHLIDSDEDRYIIDTVYRLFRRSKRGTAFLRRNGEAREIVQSIEVGRFHPKMKHISHLQLCGTVYFRCRHCGSQFWRSPDTLGNCTSTLRLFIDHFASDECEQTKSMIPQSLKSICKHKKRIPAFSGAYHTFKELHFIDLKEHRGVAILKAGDPFPVCRRVGLSLSRARSKIRPRKDKRVLNGRKNSAKWKPPSE